MTARLDPVETAAIYAHLARERARKLRELADWQGTASEWKSHFSASAEIHEHAAGFQERAVGQLLRLDYLRWSVTRARNERDIDSPSRRLAARTH
jgi:hypothetical protein